MFYDSEFNKSEDDSIDEIKTTDGSSKSVLSFQKYFDEYEAANEKSYVETESEIIKRQARNIKKFLQFIFFAVVPLYLKWFYTLLLPPKPKNITNEIALVTGGGNGLGRAIVFELIKRGARVAICDINIDAAIETTEKARQMKQDESVAFAYKADVSDPDALKEMRKKIIEDFGSHVTILFNNAAILIGMSILSGSEADIKRIMDINLLSHFWTIRTFLNDMKKNNHGHIVTISSLGSYRGMAFASAYCASKWAVRGLSEALRNEFRQQKLKGIHITTVCPYLIATRKLLATNTITSLAKLSPETAAYCTVDAMARNYEEVTIPSFIYYLLSAASIAPRSVVHYAARTLFPIRMFNKKYSVIM